MTKFILFFVFLLVLFLGIFLSRKIKCFSYLAVIFSGTERLSVNIGFTLSPIVFIVLTLPVLVLSHGKRILLEFRNPLLWAVLIVVFSSLLSSVISPYRSTSLKSSLYIVLFCLLILMEYSIIHKYQAIKSLLLSVALSIGVFSLYAVIQYIRFKAGLYPDIFNVHIPYSLSLPPTDFISNGVFRPNSGFDDVNTASGFIFLYIPFLIASAWLEIKKKKSSGVLVTLISSAAILGLISIVLMKSRSTQIAALGLLVVTIYYFLPKRVKKVAILAAVALTVLGCAIILVKSTYFVAKVSAAYNSEYSIRAHTVYTKEAVAEFFEYPLLGGGTGSYSSFFEKQVALKRIGYYSSVDNPPFILKILAENGLAGGFAYLFLFGYIYWLLLKAIRTSKGSKIYILLALLLGLTGIMIENLFHAYLTQYFVAVFLGIIPGVIAKYNDSNHNKYKRDV